MLFAHIDQLFLFSLKCRWSFNSPLIVSCRLVDGPQSYIVASMPWLRQVLVGLGRTVLEAYSKRTRRKCNIIMIVNPPGHHLIKGYIFRQNASGLF